MLYIKFWECSAIKDSKLNVQDNELEVAKVALLEVAKVLVGKSQECRSQIWLISWPCFPGTI